MKVSLSCEARHDCWFSYSSSRVNRSEAVASRMALEVLVMTIHSGLNLSETIRQNITYGRITTYRVLHPAMVGQHMTSLIWNKECSGR